MISDIGIINTLMGTLVHTHNCLCYIVCVWGGGGGVNAHLDYYAHYISVTTASSLITVTDSPSRALTTTTMMVYVLLQ